MGIIDIFWIFLMISTLQPVLQRRYLNSMRAHKIAQIEKKARFPCHSSCT